MSTKHMNKNLATIIFLFGNVYEIGIVFLCEPYVPIPNKGNSLISNLVVIEFGSVHKREHLYQLHLFE